MKVLSTLETSAHMQSVLSKVHYGGAKLPTEDEPAQIAGVIRMGEDDDDVKPLKLESVQSGGRSHEARVVSKPKKKSSNFIKNAFRQTNQGKKLNMIEISCEKVGVNHVRIDGQTCLDMGTAAYLDLNFDKRIQSKIIHDMQNEGTYFHSSAMVSRPKRMQDLEERFSKTMFNGSRCMFTSTATMGSITFFKTVGNLLGTAIIVDNKVHASVQFTGMAQCRSPRFKVKHFDLADLERQVLEIYDDFNTIWFAADSVLSESGARIDCEGLVQLERKYPKLNFFLDDCHGAAIYGTHGEGWAVYGLSQAGYDPTRYTIIYSFNKGWGVGPGAVMALPNEILRSVAAFGPTPYMFSGQISSLTLSGVEAVLDIFEDESEVARMQTALFENSRFLRESLKAIGCDVDTDNLGTSLFISIDTIFQYDMSKLDQSEHSKILTFLALNLRARGFHTAFFGPPAVRKICGLRIFVRRSIPRESLQEFVATVDSIVKMHRAQIGLDA